MNQEGLTAGSDTDRSETANGGTGRSKGAGGDEEGEAGEKDDTDAGLAPHDVDVVPLAVVALIGMLVGAAMVQCLHKAPAASADSALPVYGGERVPYGGHKGGKGRGRGVPPPGGKW